MTERIATFDGPLYVVADERARRRVARDGRAVFTRAEFAACLRVIEGWTAPERHEWLAMVVRVKATFPDARVEPPRRKEGRSESVEIEPLAPAKPVPVARAARRERVPRDLVTRDLFA